MSGKNRRKVPPMFHISGREPALWVSLLAGRGFSTLKTVYLKIDLTILRDRKSSSQEEEGLCGGFSSWYQRRHHESREEHTGVQTAEFGSRCQRALTGEGEVRWGAEGQGAN